MRKLTTLLLIFCSLWCIGQHKTYDLKDVDIIEYKAKQGIDVSVHQGKINWEKFDTSISFVIFKASEGVKKVDSKFKYNWDNCPVTKGSYHFFRPQFSGEAQAKLFLSVIPLDTGTIIPVIDVEMTKYWKSKKNHKKATLNLIKMISYMKDSIGITPMIYTTGHFWNNYVVRYYSDTTHLLWVADYRKLKQPKTPSNIPNWTIWQYSSRGKISGINGRVDRNICKNLNCVLIKNDKE